MEKLVWPSKHRRNSSLFTWRIMEVATKHKKKKEEKGGKPGGGGFIIMLVVMVAHGGGVVVFFFCFSLFFFVFFSHPCLSCFFFSIFSFLLLSSSLVFVYFSLCFSFVFSIPYFFFLSFFSSSCTPWWGGCLRGKDGESLPIPVQSRQRGRVAGQPPIELVPFVFHQGGRPWVVWVVSGFWIFVCEREKCAAKEGKKPSSFANNACPREGDGK